MASVSQFALLVFATCAILSMGVAQADSQKYDLQRRMGAEGQWTSIASFVLTRQTSQSPIRFKAVPAEMGDLTKEQKGAFATVPLVYYRALPFLEGGGVDEGKAAVIAVSVCSIVRGFDAVDSKTVVLRERMKVVPGPGTSLLGLQFSSETNFFHSKMLSGDECDRSVVQTLFPVVRVQTEVGLLQPVTPVSTVNYEDLKVFTEDAEQNEKGKKRRAAASVKRVVKNENGEEVEEDVPVDDRSFLQKYWMYMVLPIVMSFLQNMKK